MEYLEQYKVSCVIDVRIHPRAWSRKWDGDGVEKLCVSKGIKYISVAALGNTSGNSKWEPPDKQRLKNHYKKLQKLLMMECLIDVC